MSVVEMTGKRFGRLVVQERAENTRFGTTRWLCQCDCGGTCTPTGGALRTGNTKSCGCIVRELSVAKARAMGSVCKHGHAKAETYLYRAWASMKARCSNPNHKQYPNYGMRGITVCPEWRADFARFAADVGERPSASHSIERINVDGNYEPGNVRWATNIEQNNNKRNNHRLELGGDVLTVAEAARRYGVKSSTLRTRLRRGWTLERALE